MNVVAIIPWMPDKGIKMIEEVSSNINVIDARHLGWHLFGEDEKEGPNAKEEFDSILAEADIIFGHYPPKNLIERAPNLKWYQGGSAGLDKVLDVNFVKSDVTVTNASGIHARPIAEFVLGVILMLARQLHLAVKCQERKQWKKYPGLMIESTTLGIVGLGHIGRETARLAYSNGMRVIAIGTPTREDKEYIEKFYDRKDLIQLLAESDFVSLHCPLTPKTSNMIGENELRAMKSTGYLINTARGGVVDIKAITKALEEKWIAGAALDCFTNEDPCPQDSKLWELSNCIITPDISGSVFIDTKVESLTPDVESAYYTTDTYELRAVELFVKNLKRYLNGEDLINVVDKNKLHFLDADKKLKADHAS